MGTPRTFNHSAFDTITSCKTVVKQCITDKETIVQKRPGWADTYFPNLVVTIFYFLR